MTHPRHPNLEACLLLPSQEFSQVYTQIKSLDERLRRIPESATLVTVEALFNVIQSDRHESQKQRFFLYKEAAEILVKIATTYSPKFTRKIICDLVKTMLATKSKRQRAVSEAIGDLPLTIKKPDICLKSDTQSLTLEFVSLVKQFSGVSAGDFTWHGRTLRCKQNDGRIGCIKFAKSNQDISLIQQEIEWLKYFRSDPLYDNRSFHVPKPVLINQCGLFNLIDLPDQIKDNFTILQEYTAIAYSTTDAYYDYPNHHDGPDLDRDKIKDVFFRCATFLGTFLVNGTTHTALIPLFHNRAQQARRQDGGLYLWEHGGRLDQWLESCRFPNFSASGLRDFEHLEILENPNMIRHFSGEHMLGFLLVMGSVFRNLKPDLVGWDSSGVPYDLRYLFDEQFFHELLQGVAGHYYQAVTGLPPLLPASLSSMHLIRKLINTMGVDEHMEETLRIQDQMNMSQERFNDFLRSRGYSEGRIQTMKKDDEDIVLTTGPHLGGFNQAISVPELIEFLFCFSAVCVADRYLHENGLKGSMI